MDGVWSDMSKGIVLGGIIGNSKEMIKMKKWKMEGSFNGGGGMCVYIKGNK